MLTIIEQLENLYDESESSFLNDLVRCQKLILIYTKNLDFSQAQEIITLSKSILGCLEGEALILGKIFVYPSFAYYFKKINNPALSKRYVSLTLKYDDYLSHKFPVLHLHKFHHTLNLHQLLLDRKEYKKCAQLFADLFIYLYEFKLDSKYGSSGEIYFQKMLPNITVSQIADDFSRSYFICIWEYPEVESYFLKDKRVKKILDNREQRDRYLNAFIEFNILQKLFFSKKVDTQLILNFFNTYNFYHFDTYKLLILKNLLSYTEDLIAKNKILAFIEGKLNFKEPQFLLERLRHS
ncbi:hypothetical protein [Flavobacterium sp. 2755]|uniref:hypothetical protein n=1 Tax=Flavobacterium sp. 2755 TaxID=2817765 RepID=UPI00286D328E|nr:hypothetical protein [Flavobacterium sp. 2755]